MSKDATWGNIYEPLINKGADDNANRKGLESVIRSLKELDVQINDLKKNVDRYDNSPKQVTLKETIRTKRRNIYNKMNDLKTKLERLKDEAKKHDEQFEEGKFLQLNRTYMRIKNLYLDIHKQSIEKEQMNIGGSNASDPNKYKKSFKSNSFYQEGGDSPTIIDMGETSQEDPLQEQIQMTEDESADKDEEKEDLKQEKYWQSTLKVENMIERQNSEVIDVITSQVEELDNIMGEVERLVESQGFHINTIHQNVSQSVDAVETGVGEIKVASSYQGGNLAIQLAIIGVTLLILLIVGVIAFIYFFT